MLLILLSICDVDTESATKVPSIYLLIFIFADKCITSKKKNSMNYLFNDIWILSFTFPCQNFPSSRRTFICGPSYESTYSITCYYSCAKILQ